MRLTSPRLWGHQVSFVGLTEEQAREKAEAGGYGKQVRRRTPPRARLAVAKQASYACSAHVTIAVSSILRVGLQMKQPSVTSGLGHGRWRR